ncbi:MAG: 1-phosphofructokinase [Ruminococcus sp.]|jgi:1-phosphofructokinase|nr:1-phosphofructokinase [Ruminococcus sp.]
MIYTVTFNPAIDYVVRTGDMKTGEVNRALSEEIFFGGKGINVSVVLGELGVKSKALGFVAGFTGAAIEEGITRAGVEADFVHLKKGFSRINVKIKSSAETELNGKGPDISQEELDMLFCKLEELKDGDTLVLAGSIPSSLPEDIYEKIMARLSDRRIRTAVDASGELLLNVLKYRPFVVKPNKSELSATLGREITTVEQVAEGAEELRKRGAVNVLVSMAGDGAVLVDEHGRVHVCGVCRGCVRNSVGAGDSMLAGFLAGCDEGYDHALRLGTAAGGATAFSDGLACREDIMKLYSTFE